MLDVVFLDVQQLLEERFSHMSQEHPLIVIYLANRHATLGALTHLLHINLADVLLGKAAIKNMDMLTLTCSDYQEAKQIFLELSSKWNLEEKEEEQLHVQLWHQGELETEDMLGLETVTIP